MIRLLVWKSFAEENRPFLWVFGFYLLMNILDIISTLIAMQLPGVYEANPLMRNEFRQFLLWNALWVKFVYSLVVLASTSFILHKSLRTSFMTALPFLWEGYKLSQIVVHNIMVIWRNF